MEEDKKELTAMSIPSKDYHVFLLLILKIKAFNELYFKACKCFK